MHQPVVEGHELWVHGVSLLLFLQEVLVQYAGIRVARVFREFTLRREHDECHMHPTQRC